MWLQRADLVSIAVLGGEVTGPAADVALMCDLRVFAEDTRFAMTATQLGGVPASGPTLADLIGRSRALELCLTGRWVPAAEAAAIGLATIVVARDDVDAATQDLAAAILSAPRDAVVETTALLRARRLSPAERWSAAVEAEQRLTVGKPA
jgi:enoyl-CoA hydratase/carnithine racemase